MSGEAKKRMKSVVCAGIVILAIAGCAKANHVDSNSIFQDGIEYYLQTDKAVYNLGENIEILYRITNLRTEMWQVTAFPPLRDILVAAREGQNFNEIWYWSWDKIYPAGPAVFQLAPNEAAEFSAIWPQIDLHGSVEPEDHTHVPPGRYRISGVFYPTDSSIAVDITIVPEPSSLVLFVAGLLIVKYFNGKRGRLKNSES